MSILIIHVYLNDNHKKKKKNGWLQTMHNCTKKIFFPQVFTMTNETSFGLVDEETLMRMAFTKLIRQQKSCHHLAFANDVLKLKVLQVIFVVLFLNCVEMFSHLITGAVKMSFIIIAQRHIIPHICYIKSKTKFCFL